MVIFIFVLQVLKQKLETAGDVELGLRSKLDKAVEENEDLRFEVSLFLLKIQDHSKKQIFCSLFILIF